MAKYIKNLCLLLVVLVGVFALVGCGKKKSDNKLAGTWKYEEEGVSATFVFKTNKTGTYTIAAGDDSDTLKFTYKYDDKKIYITYDGDTTEFKSDYKLDGKNLKIADSFGTELTFKKK